MTFAMWPALAGGALIGVAASLLLVFGRQTAGVSGIVAGLLRPQGRGWRAAFVLGLIAGGLVLLVTSPSAFGGAPRGPGAVAAAGLLVGFGTRLGGGCTSGHGVCGTSRLSWPSMIAVVTFMATGIVTVLVAGLAGADGS